ncbi:MAG TPA: DNRLRE domain-containing protein [Polyangiaceae bacterium]|nr:DNRLRE domain-containing protein [Polyangiaceae bacterium]
MNKGSLGVALFAGAIACACATEVVSGSSTDSELPAPGASAEKEIPLLDTVPDKELPAGFDETLPYMEYRLRDGRHVVIVSALKPGSDAAPSEVKGEAAQQSAALSTVNVFPSQDTWVRRTAANTVDFGRSCELRVNNILNTASPNLDMALLKFPIPTVVTCGTIVSATLLLTTAQNPAGGNTLVVFPHRIYQPWVPGPTGFLGCNTCAVSTGAAQPFGLPPFGPLNPGVPVNQPCTTYSWSILPLVAGAGGWCAAPATNFGVLMAGRNGTAVVSFHSNEAPAAGSRPRLVITY